MPGATAEQRDKALVLARETGLQVLTVPSQAELQREAEGTSQPRVS
jgi:hypothetical protein